MKGSDCANARPHPLKEKNQLDKPKSIQEVRLYAITLVKKWKHNLQVEVTLSATRKHLIQRNKGTKKTCLIMRASFPKNGWAVSRTHARIQTKCSVSSVFFNAYGPSIVGETLSP